MISEVGLTNCASWRLARIKLTGGINVLDGRSGSGKSNLINHIGLGLFNSFPGSMDKAVSFWAKTGSVDIVLGLEYDKLKVSRDLPSGGWKVLDRHLDVLADKVGSTTEFLTDYFDLPMGLKPADLWENVIHVRQFEIVSAFKGDSSERKRQWTKLLGIERYEQAFKEMREVEKIFEAQIKELELSAARLESAKDRLDSIKSLTIECETEIARNEKELLRLEDERFQLIAMEEEITADLGAVNRAIETVQGQKDEANRAALKAIQIQSKIDRLTAEAEEIKRRLAALETLAYAADDIDISGMDGMNELRDSLVADAATTKSEMASIKDSIELIGNSSTCPTCGEEIDDPADLVDSLWNKYNGRLYALSACDKKLTEVNLEIVNLKTLEKQFHAGQDAKRQWEELRPKLDEILYYLGLEVATLETVDRYDETELSDKLLRLKARRHELEGQLPNMSVSLTAIAVCETKLKNNRQKLEDFGQECQKLESNLAELCQIREQVNRLNISLSSTKQVREAIRQAGPEVAKRLLASISHEADRMFSQAWSHEAGRLRIEPDYNVIVSFNGFERPFSLCSGGQQVTAALAIRLALAKTVGVKLLVCDESTMGALEPDDPARLVIPEWLSSLRDFQIIVVDHSGLFDTASNMIKVEIEDGESYVAA